MKQAVMHIFKPLFILVFVLFVFLMFCPGENVPVSKTLAAPDRTGALNKGEILAKAASLAVPFVENAGQFAAEVKYLADLFAGRFFLTGNELVYLLSKPAPKKDARSDNRGRNAKFETSTPSKGLVFREFFVDQKGGKIGFVPRGEEKAETKISYFKGKDAGKWRVNISSFQRVSLGKIYPGVEVKLKASGRNVEKLFYVSPCGNVAGIKIGVSGVDGLKIAEDGRLLFKNTLGELAMRAPVAWQEIDGQRRDVKVGYRLLGKQLYGFSVLGKYNKDYPLIIDPDLSTLISSTYLGGKSADKATSLVLDSSGNVFVSGVTNSVNFPTTTGAFDREYKNTADVFVAKLNGSLTRLLAMTYLGGANTENGYSLALDRSGNVYLTGYTKSRNFPTTPGAFDRTFNGGDDTYGYGDIFISKLDNDLKELLASTYLGGSDSEAGDSLGLDSSGNVYLTGFTESTNFPITQGAYDPTHNSSSDLEYEQRDAFVSRLDGNLTMLQASTYLGGGYNDSGSSLALDDIGHVYLTGWTESGNFPTTAGAYSQSGGGYYSDAFVSELDDNLTMLLASTYLGGGDFDAGNSLALDSYGNVYVTGYTGGGESGDFPTTQGAYCRDNNGWRSESDIWCTEDIFVSKFDRDLTVLLASTYLGGYGDDGSISLALDSSGNVYVTGYSDSSDFPTTAGAYDRTFNMGSDLNYSYDNVFVSKLDSRLTALLSSTYLGSGYSWGSSLALDGSGNVYLTGGTNAEDFPTTPGAYDRSKNDHGSLDVFVSKLNGSLGVKLDLSAERREVRSFSIVRQYGQIQCTVDTLGIQVSEYRLYHRAGGTDFSLVGIVTAQELQDNRFQMQDRYLEKDTQYTYLVEARNEAGQVVGRSVEKTI